jgi:hypothetical protein
MQKKHYHIFQNIRNHAYALFPIFISLARKDSSYRFMVITALKCVMLRIVRLYTYKHIFILRQCETSQSLSLRTQRLRWQPSWDHSILGVPASAR